eukprot:1340222-Karenia_brevis.AAC.1
MVPTPTIHPEIRARLAEMSCGMRSFASKVLRNVHVSIDSKVSHTKAYMFSKGRCHRIEVDISR